MRLYIPANVCYKYEQTYCYLTPNKMPIVWLKNNKYCCVAKLQVISSQLQSAHKWGLDDLLACWTPGPGCIKILTITVHFLQLLSEFRWMMFSKRYGFFSALQCIFSLFSTGENPSEHREWLKKINSSIDLAFHVNFSLYLVTRITTLRHYTTVEPRYNDPPYNDIPGITMNIILCPGKSYSKMYGTEPRYNDTSI